MRILSVVLPQLRFELAFAAHGSTQERKRAQRPSVVVRSALPMTVRELTGATRIAEVLCGAQGELAGVLPGATLAKVKSTCAWANVHLMLDVVVQARLASLAEGLLRFGATVSWSEEPVCTLWVDVTGCTHLFGDEATLMQRVSEVLSAQEHMHTIAVAEGPLLAQMFARYLVRAERTTNAPAAITRMRPGLSIEAAKSAVALGALPCDLLPISEEVLAFFTGLGVRTCKDLQALPRSSLSSRMGNPQAMSLLLGEDRSPLRAHVPPELPCERVDFEWPIEQQEALLFVVKPAVERLLDRLEGQGRGIEVLELRLFSRPLAQACPLESTETRLTASKTASKTVLRLAFATPVSVAQDLEKSIRLRLDSWVLEAPVTGIELACVQLARKEFRAASLFGGAALKREVAFDKLVNELSIEVGAEHVGVLTVKDSWVLSERSKLVPYARKRAQVQGTRLPMLLAVEPTRMARSSSDAYRFEGEPALNREPTRDVYVDKEACQDVRALRLLLRTAQVAWWELDPSKTNAKARAKDVVVGWNGKRMGIYERAIGRGAAYIHFGYLD
jgi:hypothetical protein